jgi:hypothetical protein
VAEPSGASINIPQWEGQAQRWAVLWELQKGAHKAVCALYTHPIGAAIRAFVDDELWRPKYPVSTAWRISMVPAVWRYAAGAVGPAAICWSAYYCWAVPGHIPELMTRASYHDYSNTNPGGHSRRTHLGLLSRLLLRRCRAHESASGSDFPGTNLPIDVRSYPPTA